MSTTKRLKTAGLNPDGTSRLSVTKKKKSKSRYIIPAAIGTAALLAGFGGFGSATGGNIFSSIGKFFGFGKPAASTVAKSAAQTFTGDVGKLIMPSEALDPISPAMGGSQSFLSTLGDKGGSLISNVFKSIGSMSGEKMMGWGSILSTVGSFAGSLFDDSDEISAQKHEDLMEYRYKALEQDKEIADAMLHQAQRELGVKSTFMGHTSPIAAVEGLNVEEGYQPKPPKTYPEFHPTGGLISQGQT